jgi:hypothetical protein
MTTRRRGRIRPSILKADLEAIAALKNLTDYRPPNPALSLEAVLAQVAEVHRTEEVVVLTVKTLNGARDDRDAAGWTIHDTMLGIKAAVIAQYGPNSNEVQSLGVKKKIDYRRPRRRAENSVL